MQTIAEIWERIEAWLRRYAPKVLSDFQPGATQEELEQAEAVLGVELPEDLKALYRLHNWNNQFFLDGWMLLSLAQMCQELYPAEDFERVPVGPVRPVKWHPRWIPFMNDGGGGYLCLDLAPGPGGQVGQVIFCGRDSPRGELLAPSLYWYLAFCATELEDGEYALNQFGAPHSEDGLSKVPISQAPPLSQKPPVSQSILIERVASRAGISIEEATLAVDATLAAIRNALAAGEEVRLVGFGAFCYRRIPAHTTTDYQTGAVIHVPTIQQVWFTPGKILWLR